MSTLRVLGIATGSLGVIGLGLGTAFAVLAGSASSSQQNDCPSASNCPNHAQALSDHSAYQTDTAVEVTGFVAGGAMLVTGVVMFVTGRTPSKIVHSAVSFCRH